MICGYASQLPKISRSYICFYFNAPPDFNLKILMGAHDMWMLLIAAYFLLVAVVIAFFKAVDLADQRDEKHHE